jgi:hypothetical protein
MGLIRSPERPPKIEPTPSKPATTQDLYPGAWLYDFDPALSSALAEAGVSKCGIYRYRFSRTTKTEYLVYCSQDNKKWLAYMVWPNIHKVKGPYPPDPALP